MIIVGCCGWSVRGGRRAYYRRFGSIEVQQTFYRLPMVKTMLRWRQESPQDFIYNLKAWQGITHPHTSPTWRRAGSHIKGRLKNYGFLRPTDENLSAWEETLGVCRALRADVCVLQCPASFRPSPENIRNARRFLKLIDREGVELGLELRGEWRDTPEIVAEICEEFGLIHVVDPFRWTRLSRHGIAYFRLHGIGGGEANYGYGYTQRDLRSLKGFMGEMEAKRAFVFFNNISMARDALRFKRMIA